MSEMLLFTAGIELGLLAGYSLDRWHQFIYQGRMTVLALIEYWRKGTC